MFSFILKIFFCRGIAAGVYTTNSADACLHVLNNSKANIVVVQDSKQMDKVLSIWDKLPLLKAVIQWEGDIDSSIKNTYTVIISITSLYSNIYI